MARVRKNIFQQVIPDSEVETENMENESVDPNHDNDLDSPPAPATDVSQLPSSAPSDSTEVSLPQIPSEKVNVRQAIQNLPITEAQEQTRAKIALYFTYVFLFLFSLSLLGPAIVNLFKPGTFSDPIESGKNLVTILTSVLAGPFGFIVGFYFKQQDNGS